MSVDRCERNPRAGPVTQIERFGVAVHHKEIH